MCVQNDVLRVLRVLRVPIFQFLTCLRRQVVGVLGVLCVFPSVCVLYAFCALYAFSKPYVQHRWLQKRASGQNCTDGSQTNMLTDQRNRRCLEIPSATSITVIYIHILSGIHLPQ